LIQKHPRLDYRLAVAAGYLGSTCTWHAGLSGSAPLLMATPGNFMEAQAGLVPVSQTTFSLFNLGLTLVGICVMTMMVLRLYPRANQLQTAGDVIGTDDRRGEDVDEHQMSTGLAIERSYALNLVMGVLGATAFWQLYVEGGSRVSLNVLNFAFLFLALLV